MLRIIQFLLCWTEMTIPPHVSILVKQPLLELVFQMIVHVTLGSNIT